MLRRAGARIRVSQFLGPPARCNGTPTITNTDLIRLRAKGYNEVVVDLFHGPFAPGATLEPDGSPEIEIQGSGSRLASFWLEVAAAGGSGNDTLLSDATGMLGNSAEACSKAEGDVTG